MTEFALSEEALVIGRSSSANICLEDELISREHCKIWVQGDTIWIQDLNSTNGTYIDGVSIERQNMLPGSKLQLGKVVLKAEVSGASVLQFPIVDKVENQIENESEFFEEEWIEPESPIEEELSPEDLNRADEIFDELQDWLMDQKGLSCALCLIQCQEFLVFQKEGQDEICEFIDEELMIILESEKISGECLIKIEDGSYLFGLADISSDQSIDFSEHLKELIDRQIFSFDGEIIPVHSLISVLFCKKEEKPSPELVFEELYRLAQNAVRSSIRQAFDTFEQN
jgi:two-component system, cell cycle response regulator